MTSRLAQPTTIRPAASPAVRVPGPSCAHTAGGAIRGLGWNHGFGGFKGMQDPWDHEIQAGGREAGAG